MSLFPSERVFSLGSVQYRQVSAATRAIHSRTRSGKTSSKANPKQKLSATVWGVVQSGSASVAQNTNHAVAGGNNPPSGELKSLNGLKICKYEFPRHRTKGAPTLKARLRRNQRESATEQNFRANIKENVSKGQSNDVYSNEKMTPRKPLKDWEGLRSVLQSLCGEPLATLNPTDFNPYSKGIDSSSEVELLGSYSVDARANVYIPGQPPLLSLPKTSQLSLKRTYIAYDALSQEGRAAYHDALRTGLFESIRCLSPGFRFENMDIMCSFYDLQCMFLRKELFTVCMLPGGPLVLGKIHVGNTSSLYEDAEASKDAALRARGQEFEAAITRHTPSLPRSKHFRIIRYNFGDLSFGIRVEVDACDPNSKSILSPGDNLSEKFDTDVRSSGSKVRFLGHVLDPTELVEIKYEHGKNMTRKRREYSSLGWFARQRRVCLGRPTKQQPDHVKIQNKILDYPRWEKRHQPRLQWMYGLLSELKTEVARSSTGICIALPLADGGTTSRSWEIYEAKANILETQSKVDLMMKMAEYDAELLRQS